MVNTFKSALSFGIRRLGLINVPTDLSYIAGVGNECFETLGRLPQKAPALSRNAVIFLEYVASGREALATIPDRLLACAALLTVFLCKRFSDIQYIRPEVIKKPCFVPPRFFKSRPRSPVGRPGDLCFFSAGGPLHIR